MNYSKIAYIFFIFFLSTTLFSKTLFTYYNNGEEDKNHIGSYGFELLKLSLEKTKDKYGDYKLVKSPPMNKKRAILILRSNSIENFIVKISTTKELVDEFSYVNFPVDRGLIGYRVAFLSPDLQDKIKEYDTLEKLKELKVVQGRGWLDTDILKHYGFDVYTTNTKASAFNMISLGRANLFFRAINEVLDEQKQYEDIKNIDFDKTFVLYYPLPRFFYANKLNQESMKRIEEGIFIAYKDGSLFKLFNERCVKKIDSLDLKKRKIYKIKNPFLNGIDTSYEKYIYNPLK